MDSTWWPDVRRVVQPPPWQHLHRRCAVQDLRDINLEYPQRRCESVQVNTALFGPCGEPFVWWRPPLAPTKQVHARMESHVFALLDARVPRHPRADMVRAQWTVRYRETCALWRASVERGGPGEQVVLLPPCLWCGIPTGSWCEGTSDVECMAPVCSVCCDLFAESCPSCSWWNGLPALAESAPAAAVSRA